MNYDKIALKRIFNTRSLQLLSSIKSEYFSYGIAKFIVKSLKAYVKKFGTVPTLEVFKAELSLAVPEDKATIYSGYLDGLESVDADIDTSTLVESLKSQYIMLVAEDNVETLVDALQNKDTTAVKAIIQKLNSTLNVTEKTPQNVLEITYQPSKIRTIKPFLPSMQSAGINMGGLTIIGAGTGAGKSVFVLNQLMYSYSAEKLNCCLLNLELGSDETLARMYCNATGELFTEVYGNPDKVSDVEKWKQSYFCKDDRFFNMANVRYNTTEIIETIREQSNLGVTCFGIDYLQLIDSSVNQKEWEILRDLIRDLHELTLELGIVIISPVQVNIDEVEENDGKLKIKVRGSRELENSATLFLFIYQTKDEEKEKIARIFTIKARNAKKSTFLAVTEFSKMRFDDTGVIL